MASHSVLQRFGIIRYVFSIRYNKISVTRMAPFLLRLARKSAVSQRCVFVFINYFASPSVTVPVTFSFSVTPTKRQCHYLGLLHSSNTIAKTMTLLCRLRSRRCLGLPRFASHHVARSWRSAYFL